MLGHCDILVFAKMDFLDAFVIIVLVYLRNDSVSVSVYMHKHLRSRLVKFLIDIIGRFHSDRYYNGNGYISRQCHPQKEIRRDLNEANGYLTTTMSSFNYRLSNI